MLFHRIGGTVLNASDNIILSAFVGLGQLGIYSNYSFLISGLQKLLNQLLGNFTASVGNAYISLEKDENYKLYNKLLKINFGLANITSLGIYVLITPFIIIWQGDNMTLSKNIIIILVVSYYLESIRVINISFTNACGLFYKDKLRPIIEATLNIIISTALAYRYGMIGVFIGTIVSNLITVWWREPYLLYKEVFNREVRYYWYKFGVCSILLLFECILCDKLLAAYIIDIIKWIVKIN